MTPHELADFYHAYLACLNAQDWASLGQFVGAEVAHNGRPLGLAGYRQMLEQDYRDIPDLRFCVERLVCEGRTIAGRLHFDCHPAGIFLDLPVNGRRVSFAENVFYELENGRIAKVWSVLDKQAIEQQLAAP